MKIALLIIDVQKSSITDKKIATEIEKLQTTYENIYISKFINKGSHLLQILNWAGYADEALAFSPSPKAIVFEKNTYTSYLPEMKKFDEVHLCGFDTDACILKTAMDLVENGVRPVVVEKYCGSVNKEFHEYGMKIIERNIGKHNII